MGMKLELYALTPDEVIAVMNFVKQNGIGDRTPGERVVMPAAQPEQHHAAQAQPQAAAPAQQWEQQTPAAVQANQQPAHAPQHSLGDEDYDAFGVPYNEKLHSSRKGPTKGRNQDGSWKAKKNIDRAAYDKWAEDHKRQQPPQQQQAAPQPGQAFGGAGAWPTQSFGGQPAPAQPRASLQDFQNKCNELSNMGLLSDANIERIKKAVGCHDDVTIQNDPTLRTAAISEMTAIQGEARRAA